jgi:hypothetical protein
MTSFSIAACCTGLWLASMFSLSQAMAQAAGQATCQATLRASVELAGGEFSLADLLEGDADSCPELRRAAARVSLGKTPLAGSVRVLEGEAVRTLLRELTEHELTEHELLENARASSAASATRVSERITVPERITVRRAGARASCADIVRQIPGSFAAPPPATEAGPPGAAKPGAGAALPNHLSSETECGAADRIPQASSLEFSSPVWDATRRGWEVYARCVQPGDCVPFLVRLRRRDSRSPTGPAGAANPSTIARLAAASSSFSGQTSSDRLAPGADPARVRPGQTVTLVWEQDGIRLVVPAVALDAGAAGDKVRARIVRGGALVPAIVISAGLLQAAT